MTGLRPTICQLFLVLASSVLLTGCFNTRFLNDGEQLFQRNRVVFEDERPPEGDKALGSELKDISQLQPNTKFIGLTKTRLWFYNVANKGKETKFKYWMKYKVGEPPVFYDSLYADRSVVLMKNYLENKGYFYANVTYAEKVKRKKVTLIYLVDLGEVYRIRNVTFPKGSGPINLIAQKNKEKSMIIPCDPFQVSELKAERERIANDMRDQGYYYFNKEYVNFDLDSNDTKKTVDVFVRILPPSDSAKHQVYYINEVFVNTDFSIERLKAGAQYDTITKGEYHFISEKLKFRPEMLMRSIHFEKDGRYSRADQQLTTTHLADLGVFKFINIKFEPANVTGTYGDNYLNCIITLTPSKKQEWSVEAEANNNTSYLLGLGLTFTYRNKNLFKGAELFEMSVSGSFETNFVQGLSFFNTVDLTASMNLYLDKFLVPFKLRNVSKYFRPRTIISLRNSFLRRIGYYTVNSTNLSFGYDWRETSNKRHILNPAVVSLVRVLDASQEFRDILSRSQTLKNSFTEQLIIGWEYTYMWNSLPERFKRTRFFVRANADIAGNIIHGFYELANINKETQKPYKMFSIPYAQYVLFNLEVKNYLDVRRKAQFVTRFFAGVGVAYGNSDALPYIKQFFSGGSNGIRAWRVRTLGPGSFVFEESDVAGAGNFFYDQTGDVKLEVNAEMRFPIYRFIKGAVFVDAGNIWTLKSDTLRPGANFDINRFYREIGIGTGIGGRLDFSYFVLRLDIAVPIHDPGAPGSKWIIQNLDLTDRTSRRNFFKFNIAIGYPF